MTSAHLTVPSAALGNANTERAGAGDFALVPLTPRDWLVAALIGAIVAPLAWAMSWPLVGIFHDDGVYVVTAKALAEGHGYRLIHLPGEPWQTKYPILFPAVLSLVWRVWPDFPANVTALRAVPLLATSAGAGLTYLYAVRFRVTNRVFAAASVLAGFTVPQVSNLYGLVVSEPLFTVFLMMAVWSMDRLIHGHSNRSDQWLAGAALGACVLTRSIGLAVIAGGLVRLALVKRVTWRTAVPALVPAALWFGWAIASAPDAASRLSQYNTSYLDWWLVNGWPAVGAVARDNIIGIIVHGGYIAAEGTGRLLLGRPFDLNGSIAAGVLLTALVVCGASTLGRSSAVAILVAYLVAVVVWPWPPARFLVPIIPLALVLASRALLLAFHRRAAQSRAFMASACVFALMTTAGSARLAYAVLASEALYGARPGSPPKWTHFHEAFQAVRALTPANAIVASLSEPMVYLYTGRQGAFVHEHNTMRLHYSTDPSIGSPQDVLNTIRSGGATHLLRLPMGSGGVAAMFDRSVIDLARRPDGGLRQLDGNHEAGFELFHVTDSLGGDSADRGGESH